MSNTLVDDVTLATSAVASAGIPVFWIVNLNEEIVEVYSRPQPHNAAYQDRTDYRSGDTVALDLAGTRFELAVSDILS